MNAVLGTKGGNATFFHDGSINENARATDSLMADARRGTVGHCIALLCFGVSGYMISGGVQFRSIGQPCCSSDDWRRVSRQHTQKHR